MTANMEHNEVEAAMKKIEEAQRALDHAITEAINAFEDTMHWRMYVDSIDVLREQVVAGRSNFICAKVEIRVNAA